MGAKQSDHVFSASNSFFDAKSVSAMSGMQTTTSDILFLKRLLFLRASLDNEDGLSNFVVPFEDEKTKTNKQT